MPSFLTTAALAALSIAPAVSAHGYVETVRAGGQEYAGANPSDTESDTVGWHAQNQDLGFVAPDAFGTVDIACHKSATPGNQAVEVSAGSEIELVWNTWPESHKGPVINYLASCEGDCSALSDASSLNWFKISEEGLLGADNWASDELIANSNTGTVTIPSGLSGNFVLRHEIIALHSAGNENGAQNYPQCININIGGGGASNSTGGSDPCSGGAACVSATEMYTAQDEGIMFDLYTGDVSSYPIPGPALYSSSLKKRFARMFKA